MHARKAAVHRRDAVRAGAGLLIALLAGCGRITPLSLPKPPTPAQNQAQGIWLGMDSTGQQVTGLVASTRQADFIRADGVQFVGTVQTSGAALSATVSGYYQFQTNFGSGIPPFGTGSFSGTLTAGPSITGTLTFTPLGAGTFTTAWSLTASSLYGSGSSLQSISGNYGVAGSTVTNGVDPLQGASISITTTGQISGQSPYDNCVINGTVSIIDSRYDLYRVAYTLANCVSTLAGQFAILNGVSFGGLADLNASLSPHEVLFAVTGQDAAGNHYGIVSQLTD